MVVNAKNGLNMRAEPNGEIKKILAYGDSVQVTDTEGEWSKIKVGRMTGWVMTRYLKEE